MRARVRSVPAPARSLEPLIAKLKAGRSQKDYREFDPTKVFGDHNKYEADRAAQELLRIGTLEAVTACFHYGDDQIRRQAVRLLAQIQDPGVVDVLTLCLKDPDPIVQRVAADALKTRGPAASAPLADYLKANTQRGASGGPRSMGYPTVPRAYGPEPMEDRQGLEARRSAAKSLSQLHEPGSMDALIVCFRDDDPEIRSSGAYGLAKIGPQGVDYLVQCLGDPDPGIRSCAAEALGKSGDSRATRPLATCLADEDSGMVGRVVQALVRLGYQPSTVKEKVAFHLAQGNVDGLTGIGAPAVEPLINALKHRSSSYRSCAATALGRIGDARAIEPLAASLAREKVDTGMLDAPLDTAEALWEFGDVRGVSALVSYLRFEASRTGRSQSEAQLASGNHRVLLAGLYDPDVDTRKKAISEFAKLGNKKAAAALRYALPDRETNSFLVKALSKLGWQPQSPEEEVYLSIAREDKRRLEQSWSQTTGVLLKDVRSGDGRRVENGVYTFIALGRSEIIPELVKVLDSSESKETAEVYLNCGQNALAKAAEDWAKRHGYNITRRSGRPEAAWGRW